MPEKSVAMCKGGVGCSALWVARAWGGVEAYVDDNRNRSAPT